VPRGGGGGGAGLAGGLAHAAAGGRRGMRGRQKQRTAALPRRRAGRILDTRSNRLVLVHATALGEFTMLQHTGVQLAVALAALASYDMLMERSLRLIALYGYLGYRYDGSVATRMQLAIALAALQRLSIGELVLGRDAAPLALLRAPAALDEPVLRVGPGDRCPPRHRRQAFEPSFRESHMVSHGVKCSSNICQALARHIIETRFEPSCLESRGTL